MYDCRENRLTPDVRLGLVARFDLHPTTLLVLDALVDHDWPDAAGNRKGFVYPKVARLADLTRRSERTVRYHLRRLERMGLIASTGNGGRSRPATVTLNWPQIMGEAKPCKRASWPARETLQPPAGAKMQGKELKQQPTPATAASPVGPPPRRGFVDEAVIPPPSYVRDALLGIKLKTCGLESAVAR